MLNSNIINDFFKLKYIKENNILPDDILKLFSEICTSTSYHNNVSNYTNNIIIKQPNVLKSINIQQKKDTIINKVNLILNKLSENTINGLITEFINNIGKINIEQYEDVQKTFYLKIINENKFIDIYLQFLKIIDYLYSNVQQYTLEYFFNIIEAKFKFDYNIDNIKLIDKYDFINTLENNEIIRSNNLLIIRKLYKNNFIEKELIDYCDTIILNNEIYIIDIYHWFNDEILNDTIIFELKNILKTKKIILRDRTLLEKLLNIHQN